MPYKMEEKKPGIEWQTPVISVILQNGPRIFWYQNYMMYESYANVRSQ